MKARFVVMSNGPLNRPKLPGIPGIESFKGHTFHTSRWDYDYTGGDTDREPAPSWPTSGWRSSAPARPRSSACRTSARHAKQLYVFQRTPSSVDVRGNRPTDPDWAKTLEPGWQKRADGQLQHPGLRRLRRTRTWSATAGPTSSATWLPSLRAQGDEPDCRWKSAGATMELADFQKMNQIRARVDAIVEDKATAEALKPWYRQFCKRPTFNDDYLPTFNRPNVTLVDTEGQRRRADHRDRAWSSTASSTRSTASSSRPASRSAPATRAAPASRSSAADGQTLYRLLGGRRRAPCTASCSHGFPNCFHMGINQNGADAELPAHAGRAGPATSPTSSARPNLRQAQRRRADRGGRGGLGADHRRHRPAEPASSTRPARPATTTTKAAPAARTASSPACTAPVRWPSSRCCSTGARAGWKGWRSGRGRPLPYLRHGRP